MPDFGRGLIWQEPDPRTFPFDRAHYNAPAASAVPASVDLRGGDRPTRERPVPSPRCQAGGGACVLFTLTTSRTALRIAAGAPFTRYAPGYNWWLTRKREGTDGLNVGVYVPDGWTSLMQDGCCPEELDPYIWSDWAVPPTDAEKAAARPFKIASWHAIAGVDEARQALAARTPVAISIRAYEDFDQTPADGVLPEGCYHETRDPNHEVLVAGYDGYWMYGVNWWHDPSQGYVWGNKGYFYFRASEWGRFVADASVGSLKAVA